MGIFDRLKTVISSNMNDLISKAENPEKMLNQMIIEMNEQLIDSKKAVAMAIADEKRLEREVTENRAKAEEWEKKAMLAVRAGRDDLAKEALVRKQEHESYVGQLGTQWQAQKESVEKLKESLRGLQTKIEEASRKKNILIARAKPKIRSTKPCPPFRAARAPSIPSTAWPRRSTSWKPAPKPRRNWKTYPPGPAWTNSSPPSNPLPPPPTLFWKT